MSPDGHKFWKHQWKMAAKRVLSLPDAAQVRMKYEVGLSECGIHCTCTGRTNVTSVQYLLCIIIDKLFESLSRIFISVPMRLLCY